MDYHITQQEFDRLNSLLKMRGRSYQWIGERVGKSTSWAYKHFRPECCAHIPSDIATSIKRAIDTDSGVTRVWVEIPSRKVGYLGRARNYWAQAAIDQAIGAGFEPDEKK